ncbi:MAG: hypothetical protein SFW08_02995 [Gemmatimonadaceae bacterium]|nr:hypothetical protein [Gemmatimonadaceae bacterium]
MQLFERCAALLLAELDAREAGDRLGAEALRAQRDALRDAWEQMGATPPTGVNRVADSEPPAFGDALRDATVELEHREAVDFALRERILALGAAVARQMPERARAAPAAGRRIGTGGTADRGPAATSSLDITF